MNKQELIGQVADATGLSRGDAIARGRRRVRHDQQRAEARRRGPAGRLRHLLLLARKASTGRNPRTGEPMQIKESTQPKFKAGKGLKDSVNALTSQAAAAGQRRSRRRHPLQWPPSAQAWARSSVVEHSVHTAGVASSILAAPTTPPPPGFQARLPLPSSGSSSLLRRRAPSAAFARSTSSSLGGSGSSSPGAAGVVGDVRGRCPRSSRCAAGRWGRCLSSPCRPCQNLLACANDARRKEVPNDERGDRLRPARAAAPSGLPIPAPIPRRPGPTMTTSPSTTRPSPICRWRGSRSACR